MDNRNKILDTALSLFSLRGYDAVGIQEICVSCNITKPTLYHYFGSKRGLLEAVFEKFYPPFIFNVAKAAEYHHDILINLESIAKTFFTMVQTDPNFARFAIIASFSARVGDLYDVQKKYADRIHDLITELFCFAVTDHGNMRNRERQFSLVLIGLLQSYSGFALGNEIELTDEVVRAVIKQFMHGIFS